MSERTLIATWFDRIGGQHVFEDAVASANPGKPHVRRSVQKAVAEGYLRARWWEIACSVGGEEYPPDPAMFNFDRAELGNGGDDDAGVSAAA